MTCRLGVLAFGDSITNAGGELQWGVALQSWAMWTARGLGLPYSPHAVDGAMVGDLVSLQIPRFLSTVADPEGRYELGCLYIGTNDVRAPGFDLEQFAGLLSSAAEFVAARCERVVMPTIPRDMGRPRNVAAVEAVNAVIEQTATSVGALTVDLRGFRGRGVMMADRVHPTALGQIAIAEATLDVLAADGVKVRIRPRQLISYETSLRGRLRGRLTYEYRSAKDEFNAWRTR